MNTHDRAKSIFLNAADMVSAEGRRAYIESACAGDEAVGREVDELLRHHGQLGAFLDAPAAADTVGTLLQEGPCTIIGPYKLLEQIGEGGFGVVFMAEQTQPVRRKVALKVLKPGMDTRQIVARFEAERQALALMDHPNIAKVLDGGQTPSGRPYFVMDLVKGLPITEYCDQAQLTARERLELFVQVCQAVQHAHQKGVIHRDLKPSNVLVMVHDTTPVVKVIDFGVAKALGQELTDKTLFTGFAQMIGTPLYMSPEQAGQSGVDVDTRSDIYALGVLLYELLTGTTPFDKDRLKEVGDDELRRIIREEEPPKPSTRVNTLGQAATTISTQRKSDPKRLSQLFRGELDWIVMKALEKDRNCRYETASAFAADVQRYLIDEPVQACPPSAWYRFRKFTRRKKTALVMSACVCLALAGIGGGIGWAVRDRGAREEGIERERLAQEEALDKIVERTLDEARDLIESGKWPEALTAVERVDNLLRVAGRAERPSRLFDLSKDLAVAEQLEAIYLRPTGNVNDRGIVFAGQRTTHTSGILAYFADEEFLWGHKPDAEYAETFANTRINPAVLSAAEAAERIRARSICRELVRALDLWSFMRHRSETHGGPTQDQPDWKRLVDIAMAADPDPWRNQLREARKRGDRQRLAALAISPTIGRQGPESLLLLASALDESGGREQAIALARQAVLVHPDDWWLNTQLGWWCLTAQPPRHEDAIRYSSAAQAVRPRNPHNLMNLASALHARGRLDETVGCYRKIIELNPKSAAAHTNLGNALRDQKNLDEAIAEYRKAIEIDPKFAAAHNNLGNALYHQKKLHEAIAEYRKAIEIDPKLVLPHKNLGNALYHQKKLDEAIAEYRKAIEIDPKYVPAHTDLGVALYHQKKLDEAIAEYRKAIEIDPEYALAHNSLGVALRDQKKLDEAIAEYRKAIELDPKLAAAHYNLGNALRDQKKLDEAVVEYRKAVEIDPKYAPAHNNLGLALYDQKKLDEAILEYRAAIRIDPNFAEAHCNLGRALRRQGEFRRALDELRRGHELGSKRADWRHRSAQWVRQCERLVELDGKLPRFLEGKTTPASPDECIELAGLCSLKHMHRAAARFYEEALATEPKLANDLGAFHRYNAACAAALAGCGQGNDAGRIDDEERTRLRRQAVDWLRADLAAWSQLVDRDPKQAATVAQTLRHWQTDADLAGLRDEAAVAKLPEAERTTCQKLWADVNALLRRAKPVAQVPPPQKP
jgi:tetratricopeptide (TPR) repeat protein